MRFLGAPTENVGTFLVWIQKFGGAGAALTNPGPLENTGVLQDDEKQRQAADLRMVTKTAKRVK